MKRDRESLLRLASELESDISLLDRRADANRLMSMKIERVTPDQFDWAALGYTIHTIYNLMENYFLRVAKFFENDRDPSSWHRDFVRRMSLAIADVRPALLTADAATVIDELRAFRHVFRNIYQSTLDPKRTADVNALVPRAIESLQSAHAAFMEQVREIARRMETS